MTNEPPKTLQIKYSYKSVPTIKQFAQSDSFIRAILGCFGSGKSTGCVIEIINRMLAQTPGPDGVRRTRWAVIRNCYDDQTEILTEQRGWQFFRNLLPEDKVATLQDGVKLVFEKPSFYYSAAYSGEMVGIKHNTVDLLVTPDHRLYVSKRQTRQKVWSDYHFDTAINCYGKGLRKFKKTAVWQGEGEPRFSEDMFEFLGLWFADGCATVHRRKDTGNNSYRLVITQKKYNDYVRELLTKLGWEWKEYEKKACPGCFNFAIKVWDSPALVALVEELNKCGKTITKKLPQWIKDAPAVHLQKFIKGFLVGDGHHRKSKHDCDRAYTSSPFLADDLQEIALRAGMTANVSRYEIDNWSRKNKKSWGSNNGLEFIITFLQPTFHEAQTTQGWYKQRYEGMVYCVEVSSHVVYVRRGGRGVWCSQTYRQLSDTTIKTFNQWLPPQHFGQFKHSDNSYMINGFEGVEAEVLFRALDRPDHVANLLSFELTGAWVNECREIPWTIIEALQGRVGRYPAKKDGGPTWNGIILDTNPPDVDSKFYKFFEETKHDPSFAQIFKQPSGLSAGAENLENLPAGYYDRLATGKDPEWVKVYVHGLYGFVSDGRPVYSEYKDNAHCKECKPNLDETIYRGWDFGLTPACVFCQINQFGQLMVFDEMVSESMGVDKFSDDVMEYCSRVYPNAYFQDIGDPAGERRSETDEKTCFQILHSKGVLIEGGEQSVTIRLESVRKPLQRFVMGKPGFVLHPRCRTLRKGFQGAYQFRRMQTSQEHYTEKPDKNEYSHPHDALQYVCTRLFGGGLTTFRMPPGYEPKEDVNEFESAVGRSDITGY